MRLLAPARSPTNTRRSVSVALSFFLAEQRVDTQDSDDILINPDDETPKSAPPPPAANASDDPPTTPPVLKRRPSARPRVTRLTLEDIAASGPDGPDGADSSDAAPSASKSSAKRSAPKRAPGTPRVTGELSATPVEPT